MKKPLSILFLLLCLSGYAQRDPYLDSLWKVWSDVKQADTNRLKAMYDFAWDGYLFTQPDSSYYFSNQMFDFAQKKGLKEFQAKALNLQFSYFFGKGDIAKAVDVNNKGMILWQAVGDKLGLAVNSTNFGILYQVQGNYSKAIEYYTLSLKYNEEAKDSVGIATSYHNIGHLYHEQSDLSKAIDYYNKSLAIREKIRDKQGIATSEINLSSVYQVLGDYDKAMKSASRSLEIYKSLDIKPGIAAAYGNMGLSCQGKKEYTRATDYYLQSLKIQEEIGDKMTMAISFISLGTVYLAQKDLTRAIDYFNKGMKISREIGDVSGTKNASNNLYAAYKANGQYREALEMHELYLQMHDSINSESSKKELVSQEFKYNYEKIAAADSIRSMEEKKVVAAQFKQEQTQRYALYVGLALMIIFGGFMFNRFKVTQKQKNIIEEQKQIVEVKQREILDSIHYARRIQQSLLPSENYIEKNLKRLFKNK